MGQHSGGGTRAYEILTQLVNGNKQGCQHTSKQATGVQARLWLLLLLLCKRILWLAVVAAGEGGHQTEREKRRERVCANSMPVQKWPAHAAAAAGAAAACLRVLGQQLGVGLPDAKVRQRDQALRGEATEGRACTRRCT